MRAKDFKKLVKEVSPENIISGYIEWKYLLTDRQLELVIIKKNKEVRKCRK